MAGRVGGRRTAEELEDVLDEGVLKVAGRVDVDEGDGGDGEVQRGRLLVQLGRVTEANRAETELGSAHGRAEGDQALEEGDEAERRAIEGVAVAHGLDGCHDGLGDQQNAPLCTRKMRAGRGRCRARRAPSTRPRPLS